MFVSAHIALVAQVEKDQVTRKEGKSETCAVAFLISPVLCHMTISPLKVGV